jgi:hypothetical protein
VADGQEVVDDLEALVAGGEVAGSDGADLGELGSRVVLEGQYDSVSQWQVWHVHLRKEKTGMTPEGEM